MNKEKFAIQFTVPATFAENIEDYFRENSLKILIFVLALLSCFSFIYFFHNKLGLAYNDARSHLDIGRRIVEGLKPGFAQMGSVWLPLPHLLMVPTIWNDFMWHTGLSGALQSMISYVITGFIVYLFLRKIGVSTIARVIGVFIFAINVNMLYMQSTSMTELLLIATSMAGMYYLFLWQKDENILNLMKSAFWILLSTLNRYDGWFLFLWAAVVVGIITWRRYGVKAAEGMVIFFATAAGFGIVLWFLWNQLIFHDALYFILGPYSAHAQQQQLSQAGVLSTKNNILLSLKVYFYALVYNVGMVPFIFGFIGSVLLFFDKKIEIDSKIILTTLWSPFVFNVLALFLGFSVLFVAGISGTTWFNVRYGILMAPSIAIFGAYLIDRMRSARVILIGILLFVTFFSIATADAVTIDDARVGSSQKNVSEVSGWLASHAANKDGFVLISAASHDAIIFSSSLPMNKFIHEGTGKYWLLATSQPDHWARWIIMRTNDFNDLTFKLVHGDSGFSKYNLVGHFPFADIYEIKPQYVSQLITKPILGHQK